MKKNQPVLTPHGVVGKVVDGNALVLEGEEFDEIQPQIEIELEKREF